MIRNYLKIAFRNMLKHKFTFFINLFGLTVGLTCCLLITTYIINELSYDKSHPKAENIYRVTRIFRHPETKVSSLHLGTLAPPFGPLLKNEFPEVEKMTRILPNGTTAFRYEDNMLNEQNVFFAAEQLFDFFKVNVTKGDQRTALTEPFSIMMSEEAAGKYFGKEDPLSKLVKFDNGLSGKVTGVYEAFPTNSHIHPNIMISFNTLRDSAVYGEENLRTNWGNNSFFTYLMVPDNFDRKAFESKLPAFIDKYVETGPEHKASAWTELTLQKLTDIHLHSHLDYEAEENGDIDRVYIFSAIALFILLIACINFMNLSTARSALRAREIGIRKVVGAERRSLIMQFLSESVLMTWLAMILAFALTWITLPWLNQLSGQQLSMDLLFTWNILVPVLLIPFVVGILSGLYPAIFMSSFQPIKVLKGLIKARGGNISFRQVLVTAQFAISIMLIISTAVIFQQMRYMQNKALGFDREQIVTIPYTTALNEKYDAFRNEVLLNTGIRNLTRSSRIPTGRLLDASGAKIRKGDSLAFVNADVKVVSADQDLLNTYNVKLVAGRGFSRDYSLDTSAFLINEAAAKVLGFKTNEEAIGADFGYGSRSGKLIGIFNDFHFESMHQKIVPLVILIPRNPNYGNLSVKIAGKDIPAALAHIEATWKKFLPEVPYQYTFLDDNFNKLYQAEERQKTIFTTFACIAIVIACLGLFGLSAFAISQRIKEIGIRKVLGANVSTIVALLSKDFLKLVFIAAVFAFPLAWLAMSKWLEDFAYRITIPWWIFLFAGVLAAVIAFVTISFQAVKAATANPVKSLRTE